MVAIDLEALLKPLSAEVPAGEDLEFELDFVNLETVARGTPERVEGERVIPGELPKWPTVRDGALALLSRTRDLRLAALLTRSLLATDGFSGLRDGLALIAGYIKDFWESVHPQLSPADGNDPTIRVTAMLSLCDVEATLYWVDRAALVSHPQAGAFSKRDIDIAAGSITATEHDGEPTDANVIHAAFMETDVEELKARANAVTEAMATAQMIEKEVTEQVGAGKAFSFDPLLKRLNGISRVLSEHLQQRGVAGTDAVEGQDGASVASGAADTRQGITGIVGSRDEAIRALDMVSQFYERNEPSSPVPLLISRVKRIAAKSFLEIIEELLPDKVKDIRQLGGVDENQQK